MKIVITGATGLVGSTLAPFLVANGHEVARLSRTSEAGFTRWDPARGENDPAVFANCDAVVHLAGANLAAGRWTAERQRELLDSRVRTTRDIVDSLARISRRPSSLLCASGVGFYGDTGETIADETTPKGAGFLADLCDRWEAEAARAREFGVRVVSLRFGPMLTPKGGALAKMLPIFRFGLGGPIGSGKQWMSWIALDDAMHAIAHVMANETLFGPINVVAPGTVRSREFSARLARELRRPALVPVPAFALRIAFGRKLADEALLASSRAAPRRLLETGFRFRHPELAGALHHVLGQ